MVKFKPNKNKVVIRTLLKPISKDFAPNMRIEIIASFHKVWPRKKLKGSAATCVAIVTEILSF